ncbi:hypothetical protein TEA_018399 [Camellia sinensis var. sinensis]|uniref:Uncharacterized protein n=1 Tax=Camellia sinensis var. sinensis TaxID=542762 RepID=A0A4S4CZB5_CAMSN|nr:hypothetical protein TEA_018399 [Camellia sinensis var. sinensis]
MRFDLKTTNPFSFSSLANKRNHVFVKFVVCFLLLGLAFRLFLSTTSLQFSSDSTVNQTQISKNNVTAECDIFTGQWILDPSGPFYSNESCQDIEGHQNCMNNGRPDSKYLYWRWKPRNCELPKFDPQRFLDLMTNKSWAFIGDSISRNHVQSLLCSLSQPSASGSEGFTFFVGWVAFLYCLVLPLRIVFERPLGLCPKPYCIKRGSPVPPFYRLLGHLENDELPPAVIDASFMAEQAVMVYHDKEYRSKKWHFRSHNFTLSVIWNPFLLKAAVFEDMNGVSSADIQLHLDKLDTLWTQQYNSFDYVIIAGGKWFLKTAVYYENNTIKGCHYCPGKNLTELGYDHAYRKALQLIFNFVTSSNHKAYVFFRTTTPDHFENGEWFSGGYCNRTGPFKEGEVDLSTVDTTMHNIELEEFEKAVAIGSEKGTTLKLLDTTHLSLLRPDGHPGPYRQFHPFAEEGKRREGDIICIGWVAIEATEPLKLARRKAEEWLYIKNILAVAVMAVIGWSKRWLWGGGDGGGEEVEVVVI